MEMNLGPIRKRIKTCAIYMLNSLILSFFTRYGDSVRYEHSIANGQWGHSTVHPVPLCLRSLLAVTSQFCVFIGKKMQLTG